LAEITAYFQLPELDRNRNICITEKYVNLIMYSTVPISRLFVSFKAVENATAVSRQECRNLFTTKMMLRPGNRFFGS